MNITNGKKYLTNTGKILTAFYLAYYGGEYGHIMVSGEKFYGIFNENGENMCINERIVREYVEIPQWDWSLCKFAQYIFRHKGVWYFSVEEPEIVWNSQNEFSFKTTFSFPIPNQIAPVYSGDDANSLAKRP